MLGMDEKYKQQTEESVDGRGRGAVLNWTVWACEQNGDRTAYVSLFDTLCTAYIITEYCTISNLGLTSSYMFQYYLYHDTLIPFSKRIGHKSFLEIESNAFSKSIDRKRERGWGGGRGGEREREGGGRDFVK